MAGKVYIDAHYRDHMSKEAEQSANKVQATFKRMGTQIASAFGIATAGLALKKMGDTIFDLGRAVIKTGAEFEIYNLQLKAITGSAEKAAEKLKFVREFALISPATIPEIVEATSLLEAYGLEAEKYLEIIGNAASAWGRSLQEATIAFTTGMTGEMRILKRWGISVQDLREEIGHELVRDTRAGMQEIADAIASVMMKKWPDGMREIATTWDGTISMLEDKWIEFKNLVAEAGIFEMIKADMRALNEELSRSANEMEQWAQTTSDAFELAYRAGKAFLFGMTTLYGPFIAGIKELSTEIKKALDPKENIERVLISLRAIKGIADLVPDWLPFQGWQKQIEGAITALHALKAALAEVQGPKLPEKDSIVVPEGAGAAAAADWKPWFDMLSKAKTDSDELYEKWLELSGLAKEFRPEGVWDYALPPSQEELEESRMRIDAWATMWKGADQFFRKQMDGWNTVVEQVAGSLQSGFRRVLETGMSDWKGFFDALKDMVMDFIAFLASKAALFTFLNWISGGVFGATTGGFTNWLGFGTQAAGATQVIGGGMGTQAGGGASTMQVTIYTLDAKSLEDYLVFGEGARTLQRWAGRGY